jgi:heavy metal translocating P-type ATPase
MGRLSFTLVLAMIVMMLALFLYAEDVFDAGSDVEMAWLRDGYRWASLVLATPVMILAGGPLARSALAQLGQRRLSMDALIVLGAFAAYGLSVDALRCGRHGIYFDSATAAVVLATFGRWLEATAKSKASRALGPLLEVSRGTVRCRTPGGEPALRSAHEVEPGMELELDAGQVVPVDLRLDQESAEVDLAILSGESRPAALARGQVVPAGAVTVTPGVRGTALRRARESALERLGDLARSLGEKRSPTLAWADRFAGALTPAVALVCAATVAAWTHAESLEKGVVAGLSVALAACPCSYAIASPLAHWIMLKSAFARGVLIRNPEALEALARIRTVAFDKTGTLTFAELSVTGERISPGVDRAEALGLVRALEEGNPHPMARALFAYADVATRGAPEVRFAERRFVAGRGVEARDDSGRLLTLRAAGHDASIVLERDAAVLAALTVDEQIRPQASRAVNALRAQGVRVVLLSGDAEERVAAVGSALGIEASARLDPAAKAERLASLEPAAMVGDGVNDAPVLAARTASFTLGDAAQLARGVAQITLLKPDLELVPLTLSLARRGTRLVKRLIFASTAYNLIFVGLAARGALKPVWAGLSMLISSLVAIGFAALAGSAEEGERERLDLAEESAAC